MRPPEIIIIIIIIILRLKILINKERQDIVYYANLNNYSCFTIEIAHSGDPAVAEKL